MATTRRDRVRTVFEEIESRFASGSVTAVARYIENIRFPIDMTQEGGFTPDRPPTEQVQLYQNSDVFLDFGSGRVSKGIRGLELLSKLCKGVDPNSLYLFNNVIYLSDANEVKKADRTRLIEIVRANLGVTNLIPAAESVSPSTVEEFDNLCYEVGYQVKMGTFREEDYKNRILIRARRLALTASRYKGTV